MHRDGNTAEPVPGDVSSLPRKAKVVELRFFDGLSVEETAEVLRVSPITVMREWKSAKAWLYRALAGPSANGQ